VKTEKLPEKIIVGDISGDGIEDTLLTACRLYTGDSGLDSDGCVEICRKKFPYSGITRNSGSGGSGVGSSGGGSTLKGACKSCTRSSECQSGCCWKRGVADYVCLGTKNTGISCANHCECAANTNGCNTGECISPTSTHTLGDDCK
ncbi:MAG: hypothetical protein KAU95_03540, partial [Candidatus Aenigmarchaeota archaeon]|nr:hypothetical protein [Candidatus Aenigmarchaeota archaeon]